MAVRRIVEPVVAPRRYLTRAPVIDGRVLGAAGIVSTDRLRDDLGRDLAGVANPDGSVVLVEPTDRRVFFTGWVY
jgi:hypothetical protein